MTIKKQRPGLGLLSLDTTSTSSASGSSFKQRAGFTAATTPSVNGDEEHASAMNISMGEGTSSNGSFEHAGRIREHQYIDDGDNDSDIVYYNGDSSIASTSSSANNSRPSTSRSATFDSNATPIVRQHSSHQQPSSGFSTPLLGTFSHNVDSTLPPSPRSPSFYRDKDDLSFEDPALRYGGLHVNGDKDRKNSSTTSLLNGLGVKHTNRSTSSVINVPSSPALGATIGSSSSLSSSPTMAGRTGPTSGWRAIITGRRKIHPLALGPAFLLGIILAVSGIFTSSDPASTARWVQLYVGSKPTTYT